MKDVSLIRISTPAAIFSSFLAFKAYWDALSNGFEGRLRVRKHEIVRDERNLVQRRSESFVHHCDRASKL
jgi:hypothetical protein